MSGVVVAITKYGKFEEKSSCHKLAASKYTSLEIIFVDNLLCVE